MIALDPKNAVVAVDSETTGLCPWGDVQKWGFFPARAFAFSFYTWDGETRYFRWKVDPLTREVLPNQKELLQMKALMENPKVTKVLHNASFDLRMFRMLGIHTQGKVHDTLIMAHVATGGSELSYALKPFCKKFLDYSDDDETALEESVKSKRLAARKLGWKIAVQHLNGKNPVKADFWMADPKLCERYAIQDVERTMLLFRILQDELKSEPQKQEVYEKELQLSKVVQRMEDRGVRVFPEELSKLRKEYTAYTEKQLKVSEENGGKDLNFRSNKQMVKKFYLEKGYAPKLNAKGNPSIDGDKLVELARTDVLAKAILEYRGGSQMLSAFLDPYERFRVLESPNTWVLHPNYRQCGPVTGRFSCSDPNLMQVASETSGRRRADLILRPREAFGPRENHIWYMPDYSQIEVWVFAFLAKEETMIQALLSGRDFHGTVAEKVWGKKADFEKEKSYYRKRAKLLMFCKLYGGGVKKVAYLTDSSYDEAQQFVSEYDQELPGIKTFMNRMVNQAQRDGFIMNPFGRFYYIEPDFAYKSVNYLVQGTSADILKNAMVRVQEVLDKHWPGAQLLLTLHDELGIEVPLKYHSKKIMKDIINSMQADSGKIGSPVPLPVDMDVVKKRWNKGFELCRKHLNYVENCPETECVEKRKKK